jgi:hypothetical protein
MSTPHTNTEGLKFFNKSLDELISDWALQEKITELEDRAITIIQTKTSKKKKTKA